MADAFNQLSVSRSVVGLKTESQNLNERGGKSKHTHHLLTGTGLGFIHTWKESGMLVNSVSDACSRRQTASRTLLAHPQHVCVELLERELGQQGDQILLTEQQPAALWVLVLNTEKRNAVGG